MIESGVAQFDGVVTKWYAWATNGKRHQEGPLRWFKWRARLDVAGLRRRVT